jgi:hypothetical protein
MATMLQEALHLMNALRERMNSVLSRSKAKAKSRAPYDEESEPIDIVIASPERSNEDIGIRRNVSSSSSASSLLLNNSNSNSNANANDERNAVRLAALGFAEWIDSYERLSERLYAEQERQLNESLSGAPVQLSAALETNRASRQAVGNALRRVSVYVNSAVDSLDRLQAGSELGSSGSGDTHHHSHSHSHGVIGRVAKWKIALCLVLLVAAFIFVDSYFMESPVVV